MTNSSSKTLGLQMSATGKIIGNCYRDWKDENINKYEYIFIFIHVCKDIDIVF